MGALWSIKIPARVHFFLWLLANNRVLTRDILPKRRKVENASCLFYLEAESVQHVFFECVVAKQYWCLITEIVNDKVGGNLVEIWKFWLSDKRHGLLNIITSVVLDLLHLETQE